MAIGLPNVLACPVAPARAKTGQRRLATIKEAIELHLAVLKDDGLPVHEESFETLVVAV